MLHNSSAIPLLSPNSRNKLYYSEHGIQIVKKTTFVVINPPPTMKKNKIKEIQSGAVAKSYMRKGFLIYEEMRKYFPYTVYEEAVSHI